MVDSTPKATPKPPIKTVSFYVAVWRIVLAHDGPWKPKRGAGWRRFTGWMEESLVIGIVLIVLAVTAITLCSVGEISYTPLCI